jgi:hypothetical protein
VRTTVLDRNEKHTRYINWYTVSAGFNVRFR